METRDIKTNKTVRQPLTMIIPTFNEEKNIEAALKNVHFADEILVIDSESTDQTVAIATKYKARVLSRKFDNFSNQKNFAIDKAQYDRIFLLDADERLTETLIQEVESTLSQADMLDAYWIRRRNFIGNKEVKYSGWQNDKVIRLFNRRKARYDGRLVHEEISCEGSIGTLKQPLLHYTYENARDFSNRMHLYAKLRAKELYEAGKKPDAFKYLLKAGFRFIRHYFLKLGFLDGAVGFLIARKSVQMMWERHLALKKLYISHFQHLRDSLSVLKAGKILLYPTDTVWGLGCDATDERAVANIYKIKKREERKSLVILVDSFEMLAHYVEAIPENVRSYLAHSDKPTSVIYSKAQNLASNVMAEDGSVAIRIVQHPVIADLIKSFGKPIVSTSANISGEETPKDYDRIAEEIKKSVDYILHLPTNQQNQISSRIIRISASGEIEIIRA